MLFDCDKAKKKNLWRVCVAYFKLYFIPLQNWPDVSSRDTGTPRCSRGLRFSVKHGKNFSNTDSLSWKVCMTDDFSTLGYYELFWFLYSQIDTHENNVLFCLKFEYLLFPTSRSSQIKSSQTLFIVGSSTTTWEVKYRKHELWQAI